MTNHTTMCSQLNDLERGFNYLLNCIRLRYTKQSDVPCKKIEQCKLHKGNTKLPICRMMQRADRGGSDPEKHLIM